MNQVATKSDLQRLGMDALNKETAGAVVVSRNAGGVSFASAMEVMEFAKLMAVADKAVPKHLRANPGACLRIVFQAVEWQMSPWAVADKSYEVNDRIAYESQLIHAVIEARAPLQHRLDCVYDGEGVERRCTVKGQFINGDEREYTSPRIREIKVKNSPLWTADPDQQLWYYASRAWARKWCPDVLMGIYTREELAENPQAGREPDDSIIEGGIGKRLAGSNHDRTEGHNPTHIESELEQVASTNTTNEPPEAEVVIPPSGPLSVVCPSCGVLAGRPCITRGKPREEPHKDRVKRAEEIDNERNPQETAEEPEDETVEELPVPKVAGDYAAYAERWLILTDDPDAIKARWKAEIKLRNDLGVTSEMRAPVEAKKNQRLEMLS